MNNQLQWFALVDGAWTQLSLEPHTADTNTWYYYEVHVRIGNPGYIKIVRDGTAVLIENDTINLAEGKTIEKIVCQGDGPGNDRDFVVNDIYVCDTSGSMNNEIIGFPKITTVVPSADGTVNDFVPLGGGENFEEVNKIPYDGGASYTFVEAAAGLRDMYKFSPNIGTNKVIRGVQPTSIIRMAAENPGNRVKTRSVLNDGTTVSEGDVAVINSASQAWTVVSDTIEFDAYGNFFVNSTLNTSEFGIELVGAL
jgi:hypothetical protein